MKVPKLMVLLFAAFVLALAAGVSGGMLLARLPATHQDVGDIASASASPLGTELGLAPQQSEDMRRVWEGVRETAQQCYEDGRRLQKDRDDALVALLSDEQKVKFEKISREFAEQFAELNRKRDRDFEKAVQQTKRILTDSQWQKYERILRSRVGPGALRAVPDEVAPPPRAGDL
jgi:hypothetical protein